MTVSADDLFDLHGKVAIVTGASQGLGRAMAVGLAETGADLILVARGEAGLEETKGLVEAAGQRAIVVAGDVTDQATAPAAIAAALEAFGRVDILINNAGIYLGHPIEEFQAEDWEKVLAVNLMGAYRFAAAVAGPFKEQGSGKVLNISSVLGTFGVGEATAYSAAKAGMMGFTRSLAVEWAPHGIQVNALAPGLFNTDMSKGIFENQPVYDFIVAGIPKGTHGEPNDLVGTAIYLCSSASDHVVGQVIHVDGGSTIA